MKIKNTQSCLTRLFLLTGFVLTLATSSVAQLTRLVDFMGTSNGAQPYGSLLFDGTYLYGMTKEGGTLNRGTIFKVLTDGTGYVKLLDFTGTTTGSYPSGALISDGTFLYGMTPSGGATGEGVIFKIMPNGTGFTKLLDFSGSTSGSFPNGSLMFDGTYLYGIAHAGGVNNKGLIFKLLPNGTGFVKLLDFTGGANGGSPLGSLISDGTYLYGMTQLGGVSTIGTVFKILPDGSGYTKLLDFTGAANGNSPWGSLHFDGTYLYGMTLSGGATGWGTLFKILRDGTGYAKLRDFNVTEGGAPYGEVISIGGFLYGMTSAGGPVSAGSIFKIATDGTGFATLWDFGVASGTNPIGSLLFDGTYLYGMTRSGGLNGVLFKFQPPSVGSTISITTQPSSVSACEGETVFFTTAATGATGIVYQWQKFNGNTYTNINNGGGYTGAASPSLTINSSFSGTAGTYRCKISGTSAPDVFSNSVPLTLSVKPTAPSVTNGSGCGTSVSVALSAVGAANGQYRWYTTSSEALPIAGEANSIFNTPSLNATTTYYVVINNGGCESTRVAVTATITPSCGQNSPPVINTVTATTQLEGSTTVDLLSLVSDADNNFNPASLTIVQAPLSGALASINGSGLLTLNYSGTSFSGEDKLTIQACDFSSSCAQQEITITVAGDLVIYNAVSPNGDNKNEFFFLQYIDVLQSTRENQVIIFNRWGDVVFEVDNYNNTDKAFRGQSNDDKELVTGTYYYKITFRSGRAAQTGFLYLKR